jgi:hypothetical protein
MSRPICILLATCVLAACATRAMSERQRRVSECLTGCRGREEPQRSGPFDQHGGRPTRQPSLCDQQCEAMK